MKKETIIKNLKVQVLEPVFEWLKEHENALEPMNLKLYKIAYESDISSYPAIIEKNYDQYFQDFCAIHYDLLCNETDFQDQMIQVGRTSSFYLFDREYGIVTNLLKRDPINKDKLELLCNTLIADLLENSRLMMIDHGYLPSWGSNWDAEDCESWEYAMCDLFAFWEEVFKNRLKTYTYIKDFKEHQLKYWNDYIKNELKNLTSWTIKKDLTIEQVDFDYDLKEFIVSIDGEEIGTINPHTLEEQEKIVNYLNNNVDITRIGIEDGNGNTVAIHGWNE